MLTLAAVADNKNIKPEKIEVTIRRETEEGSPWRTRFGIHLDLGEGLTRREQAILYNSARNCEVHKLLSGGLEFDYGCQQLLSSMTLAGPPNKEPQREG